MTKQQFVKIVIEIMEKYKGEAEVAIGIFTYFGERDDIYIRTFVKKDVIGLYYDELADDWYIEIDGYQLYQKDYEKSWSFCRWQTFEEYVQKTNPSSGRKDDWKEV